MLEAKVKPVTVFPETAVKLRVMGVQVRNLGTGGSANVSWQLLNAKGESVKSGSVHLDGKDYDGWGSDDTYVVRCVMAKLGLTAG